MSIFRCYNALRHFPNLAICEKPPPKRHTFQFRPIPNSEFRIQKICRRRMRANNVRPYDIFDGYSKFETRIWRYCTKPPHMPKTSQSTTAIPSQLRITHYELRIQKEVPSNDSTSKFNSFCILHSAFIIPHSAFRTPHSFCTLHFAFCIAPAPQALTLFFRSSP